MRTAEEALAAGADEVDVVLPWRALLAGDHRTPAELVRRCKTLLPDKRLLKVILETGELKTDTAIGAAARIALAEGADFIKTSTGKVAVNATPGAAQIMLEAIRECGRPAGFKAAGGIRVDGGGAGLSRTCRHDHGRGMDFARPPSGSAPAACLLICFRFWATGTPDVPQPEY